MKDEKIIERAKHFRSNGFSFREISEKLGISKSTASLWLGNMKLSPKAKERIINLGINGRAKGIKTNSKKREAIDAVIASRAENYLRNTKIDFKLASSLLYWCEGNKNKSNSSVSFTNSDPEMISYFLYVFRNSFRIDEKKFRALIHLHGYHNAKRQLKFWSGVAKIPISQFNKSHLKPNTGKNKRENYPGCINIKYFDSKIYKELIFIIRKLTKTYMRG